MLKKPKTVTQPNHMCGMGLDIMMTKPRPQRRPRFDELKERKKGKEAIVEKIITSLYIIKEK